MNQIEGSSRGLHEVESSTSKNHSFESLCWKFKYEVGIFFVFFYPIRRVLFKMDRNQRFCCRNFYIDGTIFQPSLIASWSINRKLRFATTPIQPSKRRAKHAI